MKLNNIILLFLSGGLLLSCDKLKQEYSANTVEKVEARLSFVQGQVEVNGKKATLNQLINMGDIITTAKKSRANLKIDKGNIVAIMEKSRFQYFVGEGQAFMNLSKGALGGIFKNKKNIKSFKVQTPTAVAGVRGTTIFMKVEGKKKRTYACLCEGKMALSAPGSADEKEISAGHHKAHYLDKKGMKTAGMLYHGDKEQEALAKEIDAKIEWSD